jgi:hypothetical protein
MANYRNHLRQARHNEAFAAQLAADKSLPYFDWLITVCFYAAVHYAEALFYFQPEIQHTESACPVDEERHAYRARMLRRTAGEQCYRSYRKLRDASYNVRYLGLAMQRPNDIAVHYYTLADAQRMFSDALANVRIAVESRFPGHTP